MRILTVRQPWAWAIVHGGKGIENRSRNIAGDYRGPVAIHSAKSFGTMADYADATRRVSRLAGGLPHEEPTGVILGVVDLVDVHWLDPILDRPECSCQTSPEDTNEDVCSPWAEWDSVHLVFKNPRPLREPIPYKGALGLRELPAEVVAQVLERIGGQS